MVLASFGLLVLKLIQAVDVTSESIPFDPAAVEICAPADPLNPGLDTNRANCPTASNNFGQDLLCRLFSIVPLAANTNDLATSTALDDTSVFDVTGATPGAEATSGNANGIITVISNGCKTDQCVHADGSTSGVSFAYDSTTTIITATCGCDATGETANDNPSDTKEPFECKCDDALGYVIHNSDVSQGCKRCIDFTDGSTFRAGLNGAGDACECLPYDADADVLDANNQLISRGGSAITDTVFSMSANLACQCVAGKFTSTSSGDLMCLECASSAGFLVDTTLLTDCLSATSQCEPKGFSSVHEDTTTDPAAPSVLCGCDTTKNFVDNTGTDTPLEGCYCNTGDNWWTLRAGEYQETTSYENDIDYTDTSQTCKCKTYSSVEAADKNFYIYNNANSVCEKCYYDSDANGQADVEATLLGVLTDRTNNACSPANGHFKSDNSEIYQCSPKEDETGVMIYTKADSENGGTKSCGITADGTSSQAGEGCSEIRDADWALGMDNNSGNGRVLDEEWTNEVCRPGNSSYTVLNANCNGGICQCNEHYYASERDDYCVYCPPPNRWDKKNFHCGDKNYWFGNDYAGWCVRCEEMQKQADADLSKFWFIDPTQKPECCCDCQYTNRFWYNSIEHQCQEFGDFYCMKCQETLVTDQIPSNTEEISFSCWDPSQSSFDMDDVRNYCNPTTSGQCVTKTFAYNLLDITDSHNGGSFLDRSVIGIVRGCSSETSFDVDAFPVDDSENNDLAFDDSSKSTQVSTRSQANGDINYYVTVTNPHESADLARLNAQKVINNSTLSTRSGTSSVITLNMFQDRTTVSQQRMLECYECTSDSKTTNDICITPGVRTATKMCSNLNCQAVTRSYRINGETFYYARRGCTLNPEDGLQLGTNKNPDMRKDPDSFPYNGVTNVDTYVTRSIDTKGNGYSNYQPTTAQSMSCFRCKGEVTVIKQPSQDAPVPNVDFTNEDMNKCWNVINTEDSDKTQTISNCKTQCYTKTYNYVLINKDNSKHYTYYVERDCREQTVPDIALKSTIKGQSDRYNIKSTIDVCNYQNGTLCNDMNVDNLIGSVRFVTQTASVLKCRICDSSSSNTNSTDGCVVNAKFLEAEECPDTSYLSCGTETVSFMRGEVQFFHTRRFCSKNNAISKVEYELYEGNIKSLFRYCTSKGCNIEDGSIYSEGNLDPPQTEAPETEIPDEDTNLATEEVEKEDPALVIDFVPDDSENSSRVLIPLSLLLITSLLFV